LQPLEAWLFHRPRRADVLTIAEQLREELPGGDEEVNASPKR